MALNQMSFRRREAAASGTSMTAKSTISNSTSASPVSGSKASFKVRRIPECRHETFYGNVINVEQ